MKSDTKSYLKSVFSKELLVLWLALAALSFYFWMTRTDIKPEKK